MAEPCTRRTLWASTLHKLDSWGVDTTPADDSWHLIPQRHLAGSGLPALHSSRHAMAAPFSRLAPGAVSPRIESSDPMDHDHETDVAQDGHQNNSILAAGVADTANAAEADDDYEDRDEGRDEDQDEYQDGDENEDEDQDEDQDQDEDEDDSTSSVSSDSSDSSYAPSSITAVNGTTDSSLPATDADTLAVPLKLVSTETLEFMGFQHDVAECIMLRYALNLSETHHDPAQHFCSDHFFRKAVVAHVIAASPGECNVGVETDYAPLLERMGFTAQAVRRLTDPSLDAWKDRYTANMLACMAVESSWSFLCSINHELQQAELGRRLGVLTAYTGTTMPSRQTSSQTSPTHATLPADLEQLHRKGGPFNLSLAEATNYFDNNGYTVLFKGGLWGNVASTLDDGGRGLHVVGLNPRIDPSQAQDDDGHDAQHQTCHIAGGHVASLRAYRTSMPSDLSPNRRALYMTPQLDTALAYCALRAQCRGDARVAVHTAVMVVAVPGYLAPTPFPLTTLQWQRLAMMAYGDPPEDEGTRLSSDVLKRCLRREEWLQSPICAQGAAMFERRSTEVAEAPITSLRLQNWLPALQVMVRTSALAALERAAMRKVWVQSLIME